MRFEISESINGCDPETILALLEPQLRKVSGKVVRNGQIITANRIEASFGSINRRSTAVCSARGNGSRGILAAEVEYRPSFAFWVFFILGLFTMLGWLIPLAFYMLQKSTVRAAIEGVFRRVKDECAFSNHQPVLHQGASNYPESKQLIGVQQVPVSSVTQSDQPNSSNGLDVTVTDSYKALGLPIGTNTLAAEETYERLSRENDPDAVKNLSKEIQDMAIAKTIEIRVAYSFVKAHLATRS
jgi:DnaJ-domain-containing protein 1